METRTKRLRGLAFVLALVTALSFTAVGCVTIKPKQDDLDIAAAVKAIEAYAFGSVAQSEAGTKAAAKAYVEGKIAGLELKGAETDVVEVSYTAAVTGTPSNPNGTNGSYNFTVTVSKGAGKEKSTKERILKITVPDAAADNAEIAAVKAVIEGHAFGPAAQSEAETKAEATAYVEGKIADIELNGVKADVVGGSYAAAVAGSIANPDGANGSFKFTVTISKGAGVPLSTKEFTLIIEAASYDAAADNVYIVAKLADMIDAASFEVSEQDIAANTALLAKQALAEIIGGFDLGGEYGYAADLMGLNVTVNGGTFTAAATGYPSGINGSFAGFTVTVSRGLSEQTTAVSKTLTITPKKALAQTAVTKLGNDVKWTAVNGATSYTVTVKNAAGIVQNSVFNSALEQPLYRYISKRDFVVGENYTLEITANPNSTASGEGFAATTTVFTFRGENTFEFSKELSAVTDDGNLWHMIATGDWPGLGTIPIVSGVPTITMSSVQSPKTPIQCDTHLKDTLNMNEGDKTVVTWFISITSSTATSVAIHIDCKESNDTWHGNVATYNFDKINQGVQALSAEITWRYVQALMFTLNGINHNDMVIKIHAMSFS